MFALHRGGGDIRFDNMGVIGWIASVVFTLVGLTSLIVTPIALLKLYRIANEHPRLKKAPHVRLVHDAITSRVYPGSLKSIHELPAGTIVVWDR